MVLNPDLNDQPAAAESGPKEATLPASDPAMPAVAAASGAADPMRSTADPKLDHGGDMDVQSSLAPPDLGTSQLLPAGQAVADGPVPQLKCGTTPLVTDLSKGQGLEPPEATGPNKGSVSAAVPQAVNSNRATPAKGGKKRVRAF